MDHEPTLMWSKLVFLGPFALTTTRIRQKGRGNPFRSALEGTRHGMHSRSMCGGCCEGAKLTEMP